MLNNHKTTLVVINNFHYLTDNSIMDYFIFISYRNVTNIRVMLISSLWDFKMLTGYFLCLIDFMGNINKRDIMP